MIKNVKRIIRDKKMVISNPLIDDNIWVIHDEEDIQLTRACIIGPPDTPYENGFYFFELKFPDNYPYEPFKVKFYTNDGKTRMHPNFYACGKVCVSIIGTWNGPGWTSCQTLSSVLLTFQSLFIKNPLNQEPGFETDKSSKNTNYNHIINHQNIKIGIIKMQQDIPKGFEAFQPLINEFIYTKSQKLINQVKKISKANNKNILYAPSIWNFKVSFDYNELKKSLQNTVSQFEKDPDKHLIPKEMIDNLIKKITSKEVSYNEFQENIDSGDFNLQTLLLVMQFRNIIKLKDDKVKILV